MSWEYLPSSQSRANSLGARLLSVVSSEWIILVDFKPRVETGLADLGLDNRQGLLPQYRDDVSSNYIHSFIKTNQRDLGEG